MYLWPQGRVIRTISLILVLLIAADLVKNGAYGPIANALDPQTHERTRQMVVGSIFALLALAALVAGLIAIGFHKRSVEFLIDVEREMKIVEWPSWNQLWRATLTIAIAMGALSLLIFGVDAFNHWLLYDKLFLHGD